jgi:hypothetical protein
VESCGCSTSISCPRRGVCDPAGPFPTERRYHRSRLGCCSLFHAVSKRHETANSLIQLENYLSVSPFHDFGESITGNLKLWFSHCPHSNYADPSPKTAERRNSNRFH